MTYKLDKMGTAEGIGLVFMVTFPRIFLTTPATLIATTGWMGAVIPVVSAAVMFWLLVWVLGRVEGDLVAVSGKLLGRAGAWLLSILYMVIFLADAVLLLRQFAENTLITSLPLADFNAVIAWYGLMVAAVVYFGIEGIARASYLMLPIGLSGIALVFLLLMPFYDFRLLTPWLGMGLGPVFSRGLVEAGINVGVMAMAVLAPAFQRQAVLLRAVGWGLGISAFVKGVAVALFIAAFGIVTAAERVLPFYEMARLVYLSRYVQRIEALFILLWVVFGLLAVAINVYLALYLTARLLGLPTVKPLIPITVSVMAGLARLPQDIVTVIQLDGLAIQYLFSAGVYIPPVVLAAAALLRRRRRSCLSG